MRAGGPGEWLGFLITVAGHVRRSPRFPEMAASGVRREARFRWVLFGEGRVFGVHSGASEDWSGDVEELTDLLVAANDIKAFLNGLTELGAAVVSRSTGTPSSAP